MCLLVVQTLQSFLDMHIFYSDVKQYVISMLFKKQTDKIYAHIQRDGLKKAL